MQSLEQQLIQLLSQVKRPTINALVESYRASELPRFDPSQGQYNRAKNILHLLQLEFGHLPTIEFTAQTASMMTVDHLAQGCCERTVRDKLAVLRAIFRYGVSIGIVQPETLIALQCVRPPRQCNMPPVRKMATLKAVEAAVAHAREPVATMLRLQLSGGYRPSELFRLDAEDVRSDGTVLAEVHKTSGKVGARVLVLPSWFDPDALPFLTVHGNRWNKDSYRKEVHKACDRAGVERFSPYSIRHMVANRVRSESGIEAARALLGHVDDSTTRQHYLQQDVELARRTIEASH